ncbi:hypothetical protein DAETH_37330 (plasmid) [Deinococcus aetherius]|uniref:Uncharacterized protein n=1 Tax=Deinococcus aetherius TaxID=200252 RepID=A0ABM8AIX1_9DEIO|nr:hypothetical protein [Deinococcus aetherius]BDP43764.1 hypothetical protein DAETH_37330 [Deinococcus aetherius]
MNKHAPITLTDEEKQALHDLYVHYGAWTPEEAEGLLSRRREFLREGLLVEVDTLMGPMTLLGVKGRRAAFETSEGARSLNRQLDWAYLRLSLAQLGWDLIQNPNLGRGLRQYDRTGLLQEVRTEHGIALVGGQLSHGGYSANSLKSVVTRFKSLALTHRFWVIILTPSPTRGQGVAQANRSMLKVVHVLPKFTARTSVVRTARPRPESADKPLDTGPRITPYMAEKAQSKRSHLIPDLSLEILQMTRTERRERALEALSHDGVISTGQLTRHYGPDEHDLAGTRYREVLVRPIHARYGLEVKTRFYTASQKLAGMESYELAHLAGTAELRQQLGVPPGRHWQVDKRGRLPFNEPDAVYDSPYGPVAVEYDNGSYTLSTVQQKLEAFSDRDFKEVVWGVAGERRRATLEQKIKASLARPVLWAEWWK